MLISKNISKPICSHFQCSELISKKIAEPILLVTLSFQLIRADFQETSKLFCNITGVIVRLPILLESLQMLDMYGYVSTAQHFSPAARTGFQNGL